MSHTKKQVVEVIAIGREILDGRVVDTNSTLIANTIKSVGLVPRFAQKVDDTEENILSAFEIAAKRSDIVFCTGGLGPTSDDITAEVFSRFVGEKIELNPEALAQVEGFFKKINRPLLEVQKKQALLPRGSVVLKNAEGSAPGFHFIKNDGTLWFFLPGIPREVEIILKDEILSRLPVRASYRGFTWRTHFTSEGGLQEKLAKVEAKLPSRFELTYKTRYPENHIGLYGECETKDEAEMFQKLCEEIDLILGAAVFSKGEKEEYQNTLEEVVVALLKESKKTVASVESCTGGLIANRITDVPGSSEVFLGSFVAYANKVKQLLVSASPAVMEKVLNEHGAVSSQTAVLMAEGGLEKMGVDLCISTTGIAGPTGGTPTKPVGLCYIALAQKGEPTIFEELRAFSGIDRKRAKLFFSQKALDLVRRALKKTEHY